MKSTRRGSFSVHRSEKTPGSKYSSTSGLSPRGHLERQAEFHGTTAHITQVERLDGGRMNIQAVGYQRFRIHSLIHEEPYLTGMIEHYPLADPRGDLAAIQALLPKLKAELRAYLVTLEEATGSKFSLNEIPGDGMAIAFLTAIVLPLPLDEKQQLLASETLLDMLTLGHRLLRREAVLLREARIVPAPLPEVENPFSPN